MCCFLSVTGGATNAAWLTRSGLLGSKVLRNERLYKQLGFILTASIMVNHYIEKSKELLKRSLYTLKLLCSIIFLEVNLSFRKVPVTLESWLMRHLHKGWRPRRRSGADTLPQMPARGQHRLGFWVSEHSAPWPLSHCTWTASRQGGDFPNEYVHTDPAPLPGASHYCPMAEATALDQVCFSSDV